MLRRQILIVACLVLVASWPNVSRADGGALVTLIGDITQSNRAAFDPFRDAFFKFNDRQFDGAYALDRAALTALPQQTINAEAEGWPAKITATGPLVRDVLSAAGASPEAAVSFVALDGYAVSLSPEDLTSKEWILALEVDGSEIGIGGRGPAWLMHDTGSAPISASDEAKWVWSVYLVVVGEE